MVDKTYRTRMVVDLEWAGIPEAYESEELRAKAEAWFKDRGVVGNAFRATVTEAQGLPESVEVRVRLDSGEALLWDTDRGDWTDLEPVRNDTHGNRVFKPARKPEG